MPETLLIRDENLQGKCLKERRLTIETDWVSVREIIAARIMDEVKANNEKERTPLVALLEDCFAERLPLASQRQIDPSQLEHEVFQALNAFHSNAYFVLINSIKVRSLDQIVKINPQTVISFIQMSSI